MQYPIPSYKETKELIRFYGQFTRTPKHKARAHFEYMKSILDGVMQGGGEPGLSVELR